jgi:tetrahydromethanopterin S-methyltransferase subunit G
MKLDAETQKQIEQTADEIYQHTHELIGQDIPERFKSIVELYLKQFLREVDTIRKKD